MVLIESQELHEFLGDYYDEEYQKNPMFAKRSLSKIILNLRIFIEKLEKCSTKK